MQQQRCRDLRAENVNNDTSDNMGDGGRGHCDDQSSDGRIIVTNTFSRERELIMELLQLFKREREAETGVLLENGKHSSNAQLQSFLPIFH